MTNATRFSATIEYLPGFRSAIVELTDARGEWAGGSRYEEGFRAAECAAAIKGGNLDRFSECAR